MTKEATHVELGVKTYTCTDCGATRNEDIDKIAEHTFGSWIPDNDGINHYKSCECGETQKSEHKFDNGAVTKEPTHLEKGVTTYTCTDCGFTRTEDIEKIAEHTFSDWVPDDDGKNHFKLCECGETQKVEHSFDNGTVTREATHVEVGIKTYVCADCGFERNEDIAKLPEHTFGSWTYDDATNHSKRCECGEAQKSEHKYGEGTVTKEPTESEKGQKVYICEECKHVKTEAIDYEVNNDSENTSSCQNPSSSIGLFLGFLCIIPFIKKIKIFM